MATSNNKNYQLMEDFAAKFNSQANTKGKATTAASTKSGYQLMEDFAANYNKRSQSTTNEQVRNSDKNTATTPQATSARGSFGGSRNTEENRTWFDKGALEDGVTLKNIAKTLGGSAGDVVENAAAGVLGMGERVADAAAWLGAWSYGGLKPVDTGGYTAAPVYSYTGQQGREQDMETALEFIAKDLYDEEALAKKLLLHDSIERATGIDTDRDSVFGEKTDALVQSGGQLLATAGLQAVGVPWWVSTGLTSYGGQLEQAANDGAGFYKAGASAAVSAGAEILSEKLFGGIKFGGKALDDGLKELLSSKITNKAVSALARLGLDAFGEGAEEVISGFISNLGTALYREENLADILFSEEALDEYIESFIGGSVLGGFSGGVNEARSAVAARRMNSAIAEAESMITGAPTLEQRLADIAKDAQTPLASSPTAQQTPAAPTATTETKSAPEAVKTASTMFEEVAEKQGDNARFFLEAFGPNTQDEEVYARAYDAVYEAARDGADEVTLRSRTAAQSLTPAQFDIAYNTGVAARSSLQAQANGGTMNTTNYEEGDNGVYLRNGGQRDDSAYPGGSVRTVEEDTGRPAGWYDQAGYEDGGRYPAAAERTHSTAQEGLTGGVEGKALTFGVAPRTQQQNEAVRMVHERGLEPILFTGGNLSLRDAQGADFEAHAVIQDGKVYIRADHPTYTADQFARHEIGHDMIAKGEIDMAEVYNDLSRRFDERQLQQVSQDYAKAYQGSGYTSTEIFEEVICDSLGEMNIFANTPAESRAGEVLTETRRSATEQKKEATRGPPSGQKASREVTNGREKEADSGRKESRDSFLARVRGGVRRSGEVGEIGYAYIQPRAHDATFGAEDAVNELKRLGVKCFMHSGLECNYDGKTVRKNNPGVTIGGEIVGVYSRAPGDGTEVAGHEAYHVWRSKAGREEFSAAVIDNINPLSDETYDLIESVKRDYFGDTVDMSRDEKILFREEFCAKVAGMIHSGRHEAELRKMFIDYDAVKKAWKDLVNANAKTGAKYSREVRPYAELQEENRTLTRKLDSAKKSIDYWKSQTKRTERVSLRQGDVDRLAKNIITGYDGTIKAQDISGDMKRLGEYMANGEGVSFREVKDKAVQMARKVVGSSKVLVNGDEVENYRTIKGRLRGKMKVSPGDARDIPDFNAWRKAHFGSIGVNYTEGTPVDVVYAELSDAYPTYFPDDITHPADQLLRMADVLKGMEAIYENPHSANMAEAIEYCANEIIDGLISEDVRQVPPTYADRQAFKLQEEKARGMRALEKEKARREKQVADIKKRYAEYRKNTAEGRRAKELRDKITRHAGELSRKLLRPTDKQHIPEGLQSAVAYLLDGINLESSESRGLTKRTEAFRRLQTLYKQLEGDLVVDPDMQGWIESIPSDKRIVDMNSAELQNVWNVLRAVEASVKTANKVISGKRGETVSGMANGLRIDNAGKPDAKDRGALGKLVTTDMMTPETFFHILGETGDAIYRMMRNAEDKKTRILKEISDFTTELTKDIDIRELEQTVHEVTLGGEKVLLSTAQIMNLYNLSQREQALEHIAKGGIRPKAIQARRSLRKITKAKAVNGITQEELGNAFSLLGTEEVRVAEALQQFAATKLAEYGNEAALDVFDYKKFTDPHYWPIESDAHSIRHEVGSETKTTSIPNYGMTKPVTPHANNPVMVGSVFDTFSDHAIQMATYAAWLGTSQDINRIRNFQFWSDGKRIGSVGEIIDKVHGDKVGNQYLSKLLSDIAVGVKNNPSFFGRFVGATKVASVGGNVRVVIQQPSSIIRAADMISPKYLAAAVGKKGGWQKAKEWAPIAQWKDWGYFDMHTGRQMKDVLFDSDTTVSKLQQWSMAAAGAADSVSWGLLWNACELETKAKKNALTPGSNAFYEAVAARFTEIIEHTQVVDSVLQRSQIMRDPGDLAKMSAAFMSEPTKQYNMLMRAAYDVKNKTPGSGKRAGRTVASVVVSMVVNAMLASLVDAERDKDRDQTFGEKYWEAFIGAGEDTNFFQSTLFDNLNPLGMVPYIGSLNSILEGYDVNRMDMEAFKDLWDAIERVRKAKDGGGKYTMSYAVHDMIYRTAALFGISAVQYRRELQSAMRTVFQSMDNPLYEYHFEKLLYNQSTNKSLFIDILYDAKKNNPQAFKTIYNDLIKEDKMATKEKTTKKYIDDALKEREKSSPETLAKVDSKMTTMQATKLWKKATEDQQEKAKTRVTNLVTGSGDAADWQKIIDGGRSVGLTDTEFMLYKLAAEIYDTPNSSGELGGEPTNEEKKAALNGVGGLSNKEKCYMWVATGSSEKTIPEEWK